MFPALTASSITLTPPVEDSHTGHNCFSMGLGEEGEEEAGWVEGREGKGRERVVSAFFCFFFSASVLRLSAGATQAKRGDARVKRTRRGPKVADDPD